METTRRILLVAPAALLLAACNSTAPSVSQRISLSARGSGGAPSATGALADVVVTGSGGSVRITSAQIVLSRVKLASDAACTATSDDDTNEANGTPDAETNESDADNNDESDCETIHAGPVLIDLPLDGTTKVILDALVPAGTYTGLRAKLDAVESEDGGANAFLTAHPGFQGVSVKVVGVFTDAGGTDHPFTFTSEVEAEIAVDFATPVTVGDATKNLTVDVDVSKWFKDASGAVIDPTNAENKSAIEKSIRQSLSAFEDDDHDGTDDHEEGSH